MHQQTFADTAGAHIVTRLALALVAVGCVDAFAFTANVRSQNALVDLANVPRLLAQLSEGLCVVHEVACQSHQTAEQGLKSPRMSSGVPQRQLIESNK